MAFAKTDCTVTLPAHGSRKYEQKKNPKNTRNLLLLKKSANPDSIHPRVDSESQTDAQRSSLVDEFQPSFF